MQKPKFDASQFVSYEKVYDDSYTAAGKAKTAAALADFVLSDFSQKKWKKGLYKKLSCMFGHIAEYDMHGFYHVWFRSTAAKVRWIQNVLNSPCYGEPAFTHSDVERAIQTWLKQSGLLEEYQRRLASEVECAEKKEYERLRAKYEKDSENRAT